MARSVLASELLLRLREATDTGPDTHISDAEAYRALTSAVSDTWDALLSSGIGTEGVKSVTFNSVRGQTEYPITPIASDFFQLRTLYVIDPDNRQRPLPRLHPSEEYVMQAPTVVTPLKLYYFPCAPTFTTGAETFDGINGWEEHTVQTAAIFIKAKKMDDTGPFRARKRELEIRMAAMANRLRDEAPRVVRRAVRGLYGAFSGRGRDGYSIPYQTGVRGYDLRGANLELFA